MPQRSQRPFRAQKHQYAPRSWPPNQHYTSTQNFAADVSNNRNDNNKPNPMSRKKKRRNNKPRRHQTPDHSLQSRPQQRRNTTKPTAITNDYHSTSPCAACPFQARNAKLRFDLLAALQRAQDLVTAWADDLSVGDGSSIEEMDWQPEPRVHVVSRRASAVGVCVCRGVVPAMFGQQMGLGAFTEHGGQRMPVIAEQQRCQPAFPPLSNMVPQEQGNGIGGVAMGPQVGNTISGVESSSPSTQMSTAAQPLAYVPESSYPEQLAASPSSENENPLTAMKMQPRAFIESYSGEYEE